jgi:energy-coupling factor transporter transmembrane protein EcfT
MKKIVDKEKALLKVLLKRYYTDTHKSLGSFAIIFLVLFVVYFLINQFKFTLELLAFPVMFIFLIIIVFGQKYIKYFSGLSDIKKGNFEKKYITVKNVTEVKKGIFTKMGAVNVKKFYLFDEENKRYEVATVSESIQLTTFFQFAVDRVWRITYVKNTSIILNIFLNNSVDDDKKRKYDEKLFVTAKQIFGTFGKKGN